MMWIPSWTKKGSKQSSDNFTPVVSAVEQEVPRSRSPRGQSASSRSAFATPWSSIRASSGSALSRTRAQTPTSSGWRSIRSSSVRRGTWNEAQVHPQGDLRRPSMETNYSASKAGAWSVSSALPSHATASSIRSRSFGPLRKDTLAHLNVRRQPAMSLDMMYDAVSDELRKEDSVLNKSSSEKPDNVMNASCSAPPRHRSEGEAMKVTSSGVKGSFTDPTSKPAASGLQAMMRLKRPMTKKEISAWKAKNGVGRVPQRSAEGISGGIDICDASAPAARGLEMDAAGVHPNAIDQSAFWSLELNIGSPFGTNQD